MASSMTPASDMSNSLIATIFGPNWNNLISSSMSSGAPNATTLIGKIFEVFNMGVFAVTGLIIAIVIASSIAQTAHEGEIMGRRYSSLWVPLRMGTAGFLLAPVWGGYALIQAIVLAFASISVDIANAATQKVLDWTSTGHAVVIAPANTKTFTDIALPLLNIELCKQYSEKYGNIQFENSGNAKADGNAVISAISKGYSALIDSKQAFVYEYTVPTSMLEKAGAFLSGKEIMNCGNLVITCDPGGLWQGAGDNAGCPVFINTMDGIAADMRQFATSIINDKEDTQGEVRKGLISSALVKYNAAHEEMYQKAKEKVQAGIQSRVGGTGGGEKKAAQLENYVNNTGWIGLGTYYFMFSQSTAEFNKRVSYQVEAKSGNMNLIDPTSDKMGGYNEFSVKAYKALGDSAQRLSSGNSVDGQEAQAMIRSLSGEEQGMLPGLNKVIGGLASSMLEGFGSLNNKTGEMDDPLQRLMSQGHFIVNSASWLLGAGYLTGKVVSTADKVTDEAADVAGKPGKAVNALKDGVLSVLGDLGSMANIILLILLIAGLLLAFYLPALPLIIWIMGVAGWLALLVQSMVAAPLWAASHALPEGDGFAGERAKQGYMLLLNVAMRPILLVIGFVLSIGAMWAGSYMAQFLMGAGLGSMISSADITPTDPSTFKSGIGFLDSTVNAVAGGYNAAANVVGSAFAAPSMLFGIIAIFLIGTVVNIMIIHKSFDIIYETADDVIRWIGGSAQLGGESQATNKVVAVLGAQFGRMEQRMLGGRMSSMRNPQAGGKKPQITSTPTQTGGGGDHAENVANQAGGKITEKGP